MTAHFGAETGASCWDEFSHKKADQAQADRLNARLEERWPAMCETIAATALPADQIHSILTRAGAPTRFADIGLERDFFAGAVRHAREIRNRYTFLDLAADAGRLDVDALI